jgi:acetolactate synthase-1/2/3 large subunit
MPTIKEAFHLAKSGRPGPVLVDITKDAQQASTDWSVERRAGEDARLPRAPQTRRSPAMTTAVELIKQARKPLILAGQGVIQSNAMKELRAFAEMIDCAVDADAARHRRFSRPASAEHRHDGACTAKRGSIMRSRKADLLLAFGMRFDDRVTGTSRPTRRTRRRFHVDIDPSEINKNVRAMPRSLPDLRETLRELLDMLEPSSHGPWLKYIASMKGDTAVRDIQRLPDNGHLYAAHVINDIWRSPAATRSSPPTSASIRCGKRSITTTTSRARSSPQAASARWGSAFRGDRAPRWRNPEFEVWAIVGDGGFQMTQAELCTAAQEGVKINVAIINNGYLGMVRQWQEFFYERRYAATPLKSPGFREDRRGTRPARDCGSITAPVSRTSSSGARGAEGTVVIDFRVEQEDSVYPMVPAGADLDAMIRRPERRCLWKPPTILF